VTPVQEKPEPEKESWVCEEAYFIQAGAKNLLTTLWPISDQVTVKIMNDFYEAAHNGGNAPEALAQVQRNWLLKLRTEKGLARAVNLAGPFIMSSQGSLGRMTEVYSSLSWTQVLQPFI
jgi:CHAT domain-containing protein